MPAQTTMPPEGRTYPDPVSGATVRQFTDHRAHSHPLYFTNPGLWNEGRQLVIVSHRGNAENLWTVDLASMGLRRITDFPPPARPSLVSGYLNPVRDEAYGSLAGEVIAIDLRTGAVRPLYRASEGFVLGNVSVTADGQTLCLVEREDVSDRIETDLAHGYVGFRETFEAKPTTRIVAVPTAGGQARVVHEEGCWIGHVNCSPTVPHAVTFCHEGPWTRLQRLWALDLRTSEARHLRPQTPPDEAIGHEYWFADGRRVGYHGWLSPEQHLFGYVDWATGERHEWPWHGRSMHFHSADETFVVGDGGRDIPYVLLWRLAGDAYEGPRILARHRGSSHVQILHVHPRMRTAADGTTRVRFCADPNGYGNVFEVLVPDFERLPVFEG